MSEHLKFATSSPNATLQYFDFWKNNLSFIGIIVFAPALIFSLISWTYPEDGNWISYLSLPIHLMAIWGIVIAAKTIAKLQVEHSVALHVENKATEELGLIKSGAKDRTELKHIEQDFIPNNPHRAIGMIRLFRHIVKEAGDRKFESSILIMQPYREEAIGHLFKLHNIHKGALQLGILGTFIGLIGALKQLNVGNEGHLDIINFEPLFGSLYVAFSTSVAGLEVAIILGALAMLVHKKQETYFQSMEDATVTMMSLARNAINKDELFNELGQIRSSIDQLTDRVYEQNQEVTLQTKQITNGISQLGESKKEFDDFIAKIKQQQNSVIGDIRETYSEIVKTYQIMSPENLNKNIKEGLEKVAESITLVIASQLEKDLGELSGVNASLIEANKALERKIEQQKSATQVAKVDFDEALKKVGGITETFVKDLDNWVSQMDRQVDQYAAKSDENTGKDLRSDIKGILGNFTSLNNELMKFNRSVSKIAQGDDITQSSWYRNKVSLWFTRLFRSG